MRTQLWLEEKFNEIWNNHFPDIEKKSIIIKFKGKWKTKFGHIKKKKNFTEVAINSLFQDEFIPEFIITTTIAHEICHYAHGFFSHLPKQYKYPHKHGVVRKELIGRGLKQELKQERKWIKENWIDYYNSKFPEKGKPKFLTFIMERM